MKTIFRDFGAFVLLMILLTFGSAVRFGMFPDDPGVEALDFVQATGLGAGMCVVGAIGAAGLVPLLLAAIKINTTQMETK